MFCVIYMKLQHLCSNSIIDKLTTLHSISQYQRCPTDTETTIDDLAPPRVGIHTTAFRFVDHPDLVSITFNIIIVRGCTLGFSNSEYFHKIYPICLYISDKNNWQ